MIKEMRTKALRELENEFVLNDNGKRVIYDITTLLERDFIPNDMDVYEVNVSNYSKSMIDGWTSHVEDSKYYSFYVEMIKGVNGKIVSEWIEIERDSVEFLLKLYEILKS